MMREKRRRWLFQCEEVGSGVTRADLNFWDWEGQGRGALMMGGGESIGRAADNGYGYWNLREVSDS